MQIVLFVVTALVSLSTAAAANPCASAAWLDAQAREISRLISPPDQGLCDRDLAEGWYKFMLGQQPAEIPTRCLKNNICGTGLPYWLDLGEGGTMPLPGEQVNASYCASFDVLGSVDCCVLRLPAQVMNCGQDGFIYYLQPVDRCPVAYCAYDPGTKFDPRYATQRGQNASELTHLGPSQVISTAEVPSKSSVANTPSAPPGIGEFKSVTPASGTTSGSTGTPMPRQDVASSSGNATTGGSATSPGLSSTAGVTNPSESNTQVPGNNTEPALGAPSGTSRGQAAGSTGGEGNTDGNQTSASTGVTPDPAKGKEKPDQDILTAGVSSPKKLIPAPNNTTPGGTTGAQETTVGVYPAPSQTPGSLAQVPTDPSSDGASVTEIVISTNTSTPGVRAPQTPYQSASVTGDSKQAAATPVPPVKATPVTTVPHVSAAMITAGSAETHSPSSTAFSPVVTTTVPSLSHSVTSQPPVTPDVSSLSTSSPGITSQTLATATPKADVIQSAIDQESILLRIMGKRITPERVRQALLHALHQRCNSGLDFVPHAARKVYTRFNICDSFGRLKREAMGEKGVNAVVTQQSSSEEEDVFQVALTKSNGTSEETTSDESTVIPGEDLKTLLQDEEFKDIFLSELGVSEAEACGPTGGCARLIAGDKTTNQHRFGKDSDSDIFRSYLPVFIVMIVIICLCLVIILVLVYMRCRSTRGSWSNDYNSMERSRLEGKGKNSGAVENPATDAEIMKDEGEMREKDDPLTSVNGSGPHGTYPDDDNGWVVPYDQLTMEERALPGVADTKL